MDDDIASIEDWASVFKHPVTLMEKVSKNWLLHGTQVKADISSEETDWSSAKYFSAGKDTAAAIDLLVKGDADLGRLSGILLCPCA